MTKALVMALYRLKRDVRIVLYQCSEEMKKDIFDTFKVFFGSTDMAGMFYGIKCQLILYSTEYEETVVDVGSATNTDSINAYISHIKCLRSDKWIINWSSNAINLRIGAENYMPCDVLQEVAINGKRQTLFEHYTEMILERNIQAQEFGCKFEHTHMRLGSTIHIENFYEAEILFGNKLFVSRFALLLFKDMQESIESVAKLTLYGYGTYSETVLVQMRDMILSYYKDGRDVDYIILEREEERRGFLHKDRIRYNRLFSSDKERVEYFKNRKLAIVVLINSTLKTHARLIGMFRDENSKGDDEKWLIKNYAVIVVGNAQGNEYWELEKNKELKLKKGDTTQIVPAPRYFIQLQTDYKEPMGCDCCFPENPLAEMPLIEVNAASTIPNQAYGILNHTNLKKRTIDYDWIRSVEEELGCLDNNFIYGHVQRNENHFLYYFRTENIWVSEQDKIAETLQTWKDKYYNEETIQYNILVAPMHYSNAGFVELVNNKIFGGNAILLRVDFDKEYRCNAYTKFSYLRNYVEQLSSVRTEGVLSVHFVDDSIISGRTFYRAKSLMESILKIEQETENPLEIRIFDKVFVLIDRNSSSSRVQYVKEQEKDFYSFLHIDISSLRNHGDSCVYCNLKKEADLLWETASTAAVAEYWKHCANKFRLQSLEEYDEGEDEGERAQENTARAFRRLFCTNMAQRVLAEEYHGNDQTRTAYQILALINTDYKYRRYEKEDCFAFEYFLSYIKCISRPFLVFRRSVKEAIFDIILIIIDAVVRKKEIREVIKEVENKKPYLKDRRLIRGFNWLDRYILHDSKCTEPDRQNLVKLLMKQLTELKSNYIICPEKMDAIFEFMKNEDQEEFELYYITLIGRLVGASSDTNKSVWLDEHLGMSMVSNQFKTWVRLENTRTLRDGIEKFYIKWKVSEEFRRLSKERLAVLRNMYELQIAERMFEDYFAKNKVELEDYESRWKNRQEVNHDIEKSIQRFLRNLPETESINFYDDAVGCKVDQIDWVSILKKEQKKLKRQKESGEKKQRLEAEEGEKLQELINGELDIYQYSNFRKILEKNYIDRGKISQKNIDMIICCMKVLELCRTSDCPILSKVEELVMLFKVILDAERVHFIVENKAGNMLEEWKEVIERRFNQLDEKLELHIKTNKHYVAIREQTGTAVYNQHLSENVVKFIDEMERGSDRNHNYVIDIESGIAIWKLTNNERSIWVSVENFAWKREKQEKVEYDLRKVMMFYQELRQKIFSPENDDYMNEISNARKELNIYNSNKVYTHTKEDLQKEQYRQIYQHFIKTNKENDEYVEYYPAYVLKLLSDITVSKYYRRGLRKMRSEIEWSELAKWRVLSGFLGNGKSFFYRLNGDTGLFVELKVSGIDDNEEILCREDDEDAIRDLTLLIYAIVLNAVEKKRGKRNEEEQKSSAGQKHDERVIVELVKREQYLVIQNECQDSVNIENIKYKLSQIPESEEDGISLWSMNCYIKQCINSFIMAMLNKEETGIAGHPKASGRLSDLKEWIEKLTSEEFTVQPDVQSKNGKNFFMVKVPLFMTDYHCSAAEKERGEQHD
ncbi:MAG: hypothetical protein NC489_34475 [Ruminococcus flavefaciens]|nr:hypothetical protein [Ruminococcus flavefaciens]